MQPDEIEVRPLTPERWADFEALFGRQGAISGCWCMFYRQIPAEWRATGNAQRKAAMQAIVDDGTVPGLLAYRSGQAVGWCAVAPRDEFVRIENSRTLGPIDDRPAWAIVCFFVARRARGSGVAAALVQHAVTYAAEHGATLIEAYPSDPRGRRMSEMGAFMGVVPMFESAGFREVARRTRVSHPIMRREPGT
jgi:GNAT superfamily N-acetyltransferase